MGLAISSETTLTTQTCGECGIQFAAPAYFWAERQRNHSLQWFCPNGHVRVFAGETQAQKYQRLYEEEQRRSAAAREDRDRKGRQLVAAKAQNTRIKNRIAAGVCPCCNRTFQNLGRHMGTKHPDYKAQDIA